MTERAYVWSIFAAGLAVMAVLLAAMRLMDPLYYFGTADRAGINLVKHSAIQFPEVSKARSVVWYQPRALIVGTSRAQIGLDPQHPGFAHRPVYNLAYPGASMRRTLALFEHATAANKIEQAVLAVDFFVFRAGVGDDDEFVRLDVLPDGRAPDRLKQLRVRSTDLWRASLSANAFKLAAIDLLDNSGLRRMRGMHWVVRRDGHNELLNNTGVDYGGSFKQVQESFFNVYFAGEFCLSLAEGWNSLGDFRTLLRRARERGVDLRVVISPIHAVMAETIDQAGLWDRWEEWKRQLVRIAAEETNGRWAVEVLDFSGFNAVTTEPVPTDPRAVMNNYWDPSHYKREVGNRVLDVALANRGTSPDPTFGRRIQPDTIEAHLASIRRERLAWRAAAPNQAARATAASPARAPQQCPPLH